MMWAADEAPGLVLAPDASIGPGARFGANVTVHEGTVVGEGCTIGDNAVLGKQPVLSTRSTSAGEVGRLVLGREVRVAAGAVLSAGSELGDRDVNLPPPPAAEGACSTRAGGRSPHAMRRGR